MEDTNSIERQKGTKETRNHYGLQKRGSPYVHFVLTQIVEIFILYFYCL